MTERVKMEKIKKMVSGKLRSRSPSRPQFAMFVIFELFTLY